MKTLFIDCGMGAAGDMLTAALYDLLSEESKSSFLEKIDSLKIPNLSFSVSRTVKCGITGSHVTVKINGTEELSEDYHDHHHDVNHHEHNHDHHHHDHNHTSYKEICDIINKFDVSEKVKSDARNIYSLIADAESKVHGVDVSEIHFHEVGSLDAVTDIVAVCILFEMIGADKIIASPVHVGSGKVRCAHGVLPVPAPATAEILKEVPIYGGKIQGELCTPTGAAILKYFVKEYGEMPVMTVKRIGYGMGNKDFDVANCVRVLMSENSEDSDYITELSFNVDDMTGEEIGFLMEILMTNGARDVFSIPVIMKKSRPGQLIKVLCVPSDRDRMVELIMKNSTTIGLRETSCRRSILNRKINTFGTAMGPVRVKESEGYGSKKKKIEFDDLAGIARATGLSVYELREKLNDLLTN